MENECIKLNQQPNEYTSILKKIIALGLYNTNLLLAPPLEQQFYPPKKQYNCP
jgi:hypothetical protein